VTKPRLDLLTRVCFFGGAVFLVGLSILQSILSSAHQDYTNLSRWVVAGIIASAVPLVMSIARAAGFRVSPLASRGGGAGVVAWLGNGIIVGLAVTAIAALVLVMAVGEEAYEVFVLHNPAIGIVVLPVSILVCFFLSDR